MFFYYTLLLEIDQVLAIVCAIIDLSKDCEGLWLNIYLIMMILKLRVS